MHNQLIKSHNIKYIPGTSGQPANPGQPYSPGKYVQQKSSEFMSMEWGAFQETYGKGPSSAYTISHFFTKSASGAVTWVVDNDDGGDSASGFQYGGTTIQIGTNQSEKWVSFWAHTYKTVWQPEQPAISPSPYIAPTPAQAVYDFNIGWNGGARSIPAFEGPGEFEFRVPPSAAGVVAGLASQDVDADIKYLSHAVYINGPIGYAMTHGIPGQVLGANQSDTTWALRRNGSGVVTVLRNDVTVFTFNTTSAGPVFLDTSLYVSGDYVYDPKLTAICDGAALLRLEAVGSEDGYSFGAAALGPLIVSGMGPVQPLMLPGIHAFGSDHLYLFAAIEFPGLVAYGESGYAVPEHAVGGAWMQGLAMTGHMLTGEVASGGASIWLDAIGADYDYAFGSAGLGTLSVFAQGDIADEVTMSDLAAYIDTVYTSPTEVIAYLLSQAQASLTMQVQSVLTAEIDTRAQATDVLQAIGELFAEIWARAVGTTPLPDPAAESFAWAATEEGGLVTRYSGYNFQSFAEIGGRYYGCRSDGVFLLEGATDDGVPINVELSLGGTDFGDSELKHLPNVYVGCRATDGRLFLKVETRQGEFTYEARRTSDRMETQRFDLGRGLRDNWFEFTLATEDAADFELDNIDFKPVTSKRRI